MKKYKLTDKSIEYFGHTLYRIEALKDFGGVSKGDKGGYIEKEDNLSQDDDAWVYDNARVYGDARVYDDAWVSGNARVFGNARVYDNGWICGDFKIGTGYLFATKYNGSDVTEVKVDNVTYYIQDYKPVIEEEIKEMTIEEICNELGYEVKIKKD